MPRFHLPPESWQSGILTGDEARHLSQVLRIKPGEMITVFDGSGRRAEAQVLTVSRDHVSLKTGESLCPPPPAPGITLVQAIPKGKNMDLIVQKAVELGVSAIQPLITRNTVVQPGEGKSDKWRRTALEACKQCGQDTLPHIANPLPFDRWMESGAGVPSAANHLRIIASLTPAAESLHEVLDAHPATTAATLLIGPEGDFTAGETAAALAAGFVPASLGPIILRVETAALFAISALRYEFG
jgi:16S rRNA (uracil1498-N3)-methyltransferase